MPGGRSNYMGGRHLERMREGGLQFRVEDSRGKRLKEKRICPSLSYPVLYALRTLNPPATGSGALLPQPCRAAAASIMIISCALPPARFELDC